MVHGLQPPSLQLQARILRAMREHMWRHGIPPTMAELATAVGRAQSTVWRQLQLLQTAGLVRRTGRPQRGYEPTVVVRD